MRVVLVVDCDWKYLGVFASNLEADGHEAIPFQSPLRALDYCTRQDTPLDRVYIHLSQSGPGAGLWLAGQIARARPGVPVAATSAHFTIVPASMPSTVRLLPKSLQMREQLRTLAEGREAPLSSGTMALYGSHIGAA